ncbi:MAG: hypothetical protein KBA95_04620 [Acidobacteria bacterium]|nr:hypothetical protein [Acidobacteriota bacterium]
MTTPPDSPRRAAIALLLWAWHTVLALVVAFPFFTWMSRETGVAPGTDPLLDGIQFGTLFELLQDSAGSLRGVPAALISAIGLALLSNALLGGGLFALAAGRAAAEGRLLARFFEAAGRFFLRSVGLIALSAVAVLAVGGTAAALAGAVLEPILARAGEPGDVAQAALTMALVACVAAYFVLALDYARVWMVRHDARGVVRTWLRGAWFVLRHPAKAAMPGVVYGLGIAAALALGAWIGGAPGGRTWVVIAGVLAAQQALLYLRVLLRVNMVVAEGRAAAGWEPEPDAAPAPAPASLPSSSAGIQ